ncbi:MAG: hypothetical protein LBI55_04075 [Oscillospiraceae bacterium]|nr:hypothetical protein [Oscillospiraceae bacterium]
MKDMIGQIIEMDKKAREATELIQKDRLNLEQEILLLKQKIRDKYLERVQKRLLKNRVLEREHSKRVLAQIKITQDDTLKKLNLLYKENKNLWVEQICSRVLG